MSAHLRQEIANWAHALVAAAGMLSVAYGLFQSMIDQMFMGTIPPDVTRWEMLVGAAITLVSKFIDSANNALKSQNLPPADLGASH